MNDTTLGEILVRTGVISETQRMSAMDYQHRSDNPVAFGDILVHHGFCTRDAVEEAAKLQTKLRSDKTHVKAEAFSDVARRSKEALSTTRRKLIAAGKDIIRKSGTEDIPTPVLGVPIIGG